MGLFSKMFGDYSTREIKRIRPLCDKTLELATKYKTYSDEQLRGETERFKNAMS